MTTWSETEWSELEQLLHLRDVKTAMARVHAKGAEALGPLGQTPLFAAARGGTGAVAKALLDAGVRADVVSSEGRTALSIAVITRNTSVAAVLKKLPYPRPPVEQVLFRLGTPSDYAGIGRAVSRDLLSGLLAFFVKEFRGRCIKVGVKPLLPPNYQDAVAALYRKSYAPWVQLLLHEGAVSASALFDATECACVDQLRDLIRGGHRRELLETAYGRDSTRSQFAVPVVRAAWKEAEKAAADVSNT